MKTAKLCVVVRLAILAGLVLKSDRGMDRGGLAGRRVTRPKAAPSSVTRVTDTSDPARFRMSG